jgi:uncharacterized cupredoxin-like copper-binding protein
MEKLTAWVYPQSQVFIEVVFSRSSKMKKVLILSGIVFLLSILLAACGPQKVERDIEMTDFKFNPDTIEVPASTNVTLNLSNTGTLEHDYVIMILGKNASLPFDDDDKNNIYWEHKLEKGESVQLEFTAPSEPGEYQVVCATAGHLEQGMQGKLIVTEK